MKISKCLILILTCATFACAPRPRTVTQFNVETYIRPYQTHLGEKLTIVLDEEIPNDFEVRDNFKPMEVLNFRNSLKLTLFYTFENSFESVQFQDQPASDGLSLHLYRVRPSWKLHTIDDNVVAAGEIVVSSNTYFLSSLIRYDGVIYRDGEKVKVLDEEVISEKVETNIRRWNEAFVDGVREMSEDIYRQLVEEQKAFLSRK